MFSMKDVTVMLIVLIICFVLIMFVVAKATLA